MFFGVSGACEVEAGEVGGGEVDVGGKGGGDVVGGWCWCEDWYEGRKTIL